jgi:hypothetical protein
MEIFIAVAVILIGSVFAYKISSFRRSTFIVTYPFPATIKERVKIKYPHLNNEQLELVIVALRDYFLICNQAGRRMISMPSQVVDVAWHEFILFTRAYKTFCHKGLGRFLHHTPAEAMKAPTIAQDGIKRAWKLACKKEKIDPKNATYLPLLFSIDADLAIEDGFKYVKNCTSEKGTAVYCAGHIGCGGGCSGCSSGDGCGGSGCGGD